MLVPPILEIHVLWHPDDKDGAAVCEGLLDHFRGTTYSGLVGGAVDVYVRSQSWAGDGGPPRPLPFVQALPNGLPGPQLTVVVPVLGAHLARAVGTDPRWQQYFLDMMSAARRTPSEVGVFVLDVDDVGGDRSELRSLLGIRTYLPRWCQNDTRAMCRELAHRIATMIGDPLGERLQVFISHTKRRAVREAAAVSDGVLDVVRSVIAKRTRLVGLFDDTDLVTGSDWDEALRVAAAESALLIVRTDLYAGREWCQREVLMAKEAGMPIVTLYAVQDREERGSFLMDHVPVVPLPVIGKPEKYKPREDKPGKGVKAWSDAVERALDQLVDEALKRALWRHQQRFLRDLGFQWLPPSAPEPVTLGPWLRQLQDERRNSAAPSGGDQPRVLVMHPDPPLGPEEARVVDQLAVLSGLAPGVIEVLTPRTFASRGGRPRGAAAGTGSAR